MKYFAIFATRCLTTVIVLIPAVAIDLKPEMRFEIGVREMKNIFRTPFQHPYVKHNKRHAEVCMRRKNPLKNQGI